MSSRGQAVNIWATFHRWTDEAAAEAALVEHAVIHTAEKELAMLSQDFTNIVSQINSALQRAADNKASDASTISAQAAQIGTLNAQVSDLQGQLTEAQNAVASVAAAADNLAPPPAQ